MKKRENTSLDVRANLDVSVDATKSIDRVTDSVLGMIEPPVLKVSEIVTGLFSFVNETIDAGFYIYRENLDYYKKRFHAKIRNKIAKIPEEYLCVPDIGIVGESLEVLKYHLDKDYLVELYSSILAGSLDTRIRNRIHPTFISIVKDLSYGDIQLLEAMYRYHGKDQMWIPIICLSLVSDSKVMKKNFKNERYFLALDGYDFDIAQSAISIDNLLRLNLITLDFEHWLSSEAEIYKGLLEQAEEIYKPTFQSLESEYGCECHVKIKAKGTFCLTNLGYSLLDICLSK